MHTMGTSFVGKVRDVRQIAEAQIGEGVADMVDFEAQVNWHEATEKADRIPVFPDLAGNKFAASGLFVTSDLTLVSPYNTSLAPPT